MEGGLEQETAEDFLRQRHFYAKKPLMRAPLWAIYGSSIHPFSVSSVLLGS
jgi:hypothetical protein